MLSLMRRKAGSWIIKILLGAIVIVFVFWGVGSFRDEGQAHVAKVNGKAITVEEYRETYSNLLEQMRQRFGGNLTTELLEMLQIRQQALNQLIEKRLLMLEAQNMGLTVTDQELSASITRYPVFLNNGVFDPQLYQRVLLANRLTPESFEAMQREMLLLDKVRAFVTDSVKISDTEMREWHQWRNTEIRFDYVVFAPGDFSDVVVSPEAIEEYYDENTNRYMSEPKRRLRYLPFTAEAYASRVVISEAEIAAFFESQRADFVTPQTVEARHILLRVPDDADEAAEEAIRRQAEELIARLAALESFEELAQQYSDDAGQDGAGYLGYFEYEDMVTPFSEAAFAMNPGEVSPPVRTQFGWHIIRVEDVREARDPSLDDVQEDIRERLRTQAARQEALQAAEDLYLDAFDDDDLNVLAAAHDLEVFETDYFSRNAPPPDLPNATTLANAAFGLPVMEISEVVEAGDNFFLLQVLDALPAEKLPLSEVAERVEADVRRSLQDQAAADAAAQFSETLQNRGTMVEAAQMHNLTVQTTDFFKRRDAIPGIGHETELAQTAFTLSFENPISEAPIKARNGYYVIAFQERRLPSDDAYLSEIDGIRTELTTRKQQEVYQALVTRLKEESTITIEDAYQF